MEGTSTILNLILLADKMPEKEPTFWGLFRRYRSFKTAMTYLISLSTILAQRFPQFYPELVGKSRIELEDILMEKLL